MKLSAILAPLIAAGVSGEVILATVRAFEDQQIDALEKRRESDRKRQADKRLRDVTLRHSDSLLVTRGEDNSSTSHPTEKKEEKKASPSAQRRGERIPSDFAPDIEAAVSEGLSRQEAEREARTFVDYWRARPGKEALKLDWPATWRVWFRKRLEAPSHRSTAPPGKRLNASEAFQSLNGDYRNEPESSTVDHGDDERVSADQPRLQALARNLGQTMRWDG